MSLKKIRVLHVVSKMKLGGGLPGWLYEVMKHLDHKRFQFDFLCILSDETFPEESILEAMGAKIFKCKAASRKILSVKAVAQIFGIMRNNYDIADHHLAFQEYPMLVAFLCGIPVRICHVHNDPRHYLTSSRVGFFGNLRRHYKRFILKTLSTHWVAVSSCAGRYYFGNNYKVLSCGINLEPFGVEYDRDSVLKEMGISLDSFILGHVGRLEVEQKNCFFIVEVFRELLREHSEAILLWCGSGQDESRVKAYAKECGVFPSIRFAGIRSDIPRLMSVMDAFLLPSFYEGLGLVLVEAQASGVPCVFSDVVPVDADVVPEWCYRIPLRETAGYWAEKIHRVARNNPVVADRKLALRRVSRSPFNIEISTQRLCEFYEKSLG